LIYTNIGWKVDGNAVMGRGTALQAVTRYPFLSQQYGEYCRIHQENTGILVYEDIRLILMPTKPLKADAPWHSWMNNADVELIKRGLAEVDKFLISHERVHLAMPLPGCGEGGIPDKFAIKLAKQYFGKFQRVTVCDYLL
jgi:hypothetical protein